MTLGFLVRGVVDEAQLFQAVARALGVPPDEVARFDGDRKSDAVVLVEVFHRTAGFLTDVSLYCDPQRMPGADARSSVEVVPSIARDLGDEMLVSPPGDDVHADAADTWYLIDPAGQRFVVRALLRDDSSENIEIDRATLRPA